MKYASDFFEKKRPNCNNNSQVHPDKTMVET